MLPKEDKGVKRLKIGFLSIYLFLAIFSACSPALEEGQLQGYYKQALQHYRDGKFAEAIGESEQFLPHTQNDTLYANTCMIAGASYRQLEEYTTAIQYYQKALSIRRELYGEQHPRIGDIYNNLGVVYWRKEDYKQALNYYKKDLKIQEITGTTIPSTYDNIAKVYRGLKKYSLALDYYRKALKHQPKEDKHYSLNNIGWLYLTQGQYDKAQKYLEKALANEKKYLDKEDYICAVTLNNLGYNAHLQKNYKKALTYYKKAAAIPHAHARTTLENLEYRAGTLKSMGRQAEALALLQTADKRIAAVRRNMHLLADKLFFSEKASKINQLAISLCVELENYKLAFYFSERNKANVLESSLQTKPVARIKAIQKKLKKRQALLEYTFLDKEKKLVAFALTPDTFEARVFPMDFEKDMDRFLYSTATPFEKARFLHHGYVLYQKLFRPMEKNFAKIEDIIIIPDGKLNYIPFEAMVRADYQYKNSTKTLEMNYQGYDYLIHRYAISYSPSATVALRSKKKQKYRYDYIAFAADLPGLDYARHEIQDHGRYFFYKQLYRKEWANARYFKTIKSARILQLNTRAVYLNQVTNPEDLAFRMSADTLTQKDIARTNLHTDLTVLTSCTNIEGAYVEGEGVVNIAQQFIPKSNHVIYSLFNIREEFAYNLMRRFYTNISKKMSYKEALRLAKLQTLTQPEILPMEWAQVVLME